MNTSSSERRALPWAPFWLVSRPLWMGGFLLSTIIYGIGGTLLALALARWAGRPAPTWVAVTMVLTTLSLVFPAHRAGHRDRHEGCPIGVPFRGRRGDHGHAAGPRPR